MQFAYFTKHWPNSSVEDLVRLARDIGADGLDLAVRAGQAVSPQNVTKALPAAVRTCRSSGTCVSMVTMETKPTDPKDPAVEAIFAACGQAGIKCIKPGYFLHQAGTDYWAEVDRLRGVLEELGRLAARHGVVVCYHTHSGPFHGSNAAGLMHLLRGQDPDVLGAYIDVGHLVLNGEEFPLALDMVRDHLRLVGVKSAIWEPRLEGGRKLWKPKFVPLSEGLVDCKQMMSELARVGFDGVLAFHGEAEVPAEQLPAVLRDEIACCRQLLQRK